MRVFKFSNERPLTNSLSELKEKAEYAQTSKGKWYHWKRVYVIKSSGQEYGLVSLNFFERLARNICKIDIFKKAFEGKKITIISPKTLPIIYNITKPLIAENSIPNEQLVPRKEANSFSFNFKDHELPLKAIYADENLRNQLKNSLQSEGAIKRFLNDFKVYMDSFPLGDLNPVLGEELISKQMNILNGLKAKVINGHLKNIIHNHLDNIITCEDPLYEYPDPQIRNYFHYLIKNQVIWGWGNNRAEMYLILSKPTGDFHRYCGDGKYYLRVDSEIHVRYVFRGNVESEKAVEITDSI